MTHNTLETSLELELGTETRSQYGTGTFVTGMYSNRIKTQFSVPYFSAT